MHSNYIVLKTNKALCDLQDPKLSIMTVLANFVYRKNVTYFIKLFSQETLNALQFLP